MIPVHQKEKDILFDIIERYGFCPIHSQERKICIQRKNSLVSYDIFPVSPNYPVDEEVRILMEKLRGRRHFSEFLRKKTKSY